MSLSRVQILREVVKKLVPMLAGQGLVVTQIGSQASCHYDNNGKPIRINIPHIADNADDQFCDAIQGFIDHECGHVLFTDSSVTKRTIKIGTKKALDFKRPVEGTVKRLHLLCNLLEDTRIEREMCKRFKGTGYNLERTRELFINKITAKAIEATKDDPQRRFEVLMMPMFRALAGQESFKRFMDDGGYWDNEYVKAFLEYAPKRVLDQLPKIESTSEALDLASDIYNVLYPKAEEKEAPPPLPSPSTPPSPSSSPAGSGGGGGGSSSESDAEDEEGKAGESGGSSKKNEKEKNDAAEASPKDGAGEASSGEDDRDGEDDSDLVPENDEDEGEEKASDGSSEEDGAAEADDGGGTPASNSDDAREEEGGSPGSSGDEEGEEGDVGGAGSSEDEEGDGATGGGAGEGGGEGSGAGDVDGELSATKAEGEEKAVGGHGSSPFATFDATPKNSDLSNAIAQVLSDESLRQSRNLDYRVLTRDFDTIAPLPDEEPHRGTVAELEDSTRHMVGPMQKAIERMMAARSQVLKVPGFRSGRLHGGSLHRLIVNDDRVFRRTHVSRSKETAVELLVDNSGSMMGRKIEIAMKSAYALSQTLERVGISHEVIGFTTERPSANIVKLSREEQARLGHSYPIHRHEPIYMPIYKGFDERLNPVIKRRFVQGYGGNVDLDGNVDGESVRYAGERLLRRRETRKVMIVLSDGNPAGWTSHREALFSDLHRAIEELEAKKVEVIGLGIMSHAVETFYQKHSVIDDLNQLPAAVMGELQRILTAA